MSLIFTTGLALHGQTVQFQHKGHLISY